MSNQTQTQTRARIERIAYNRVRYYRPDTEHGLTGCDIEFSVPTNGGYVRDDQGRQVCERLARRGYTLESSPENLLDVIRAEHRSAMRAA